MTHALERLPKNLDARQYHSLQDLGDCLIPGFENLPSFSGSGCALEADRILDHMPAADRKDLKLLLTVLSYLPRFCIRGLVRILEYSPYLPDFLGPIAGGLRFIRLGIRGLVMTLYYSHPEIQKNLGFQVDVYTADR